MASNLSPEEALVGLNCSSWATRICQDEHVIQFGWWHVRRQLLGLPGKKFPLSSIGTTGRKLSSSLEAWRVWRRGLKTPGRGRTSLTEEGTVERMTQKWRRSHDIVISRSFLLNLNGRDTAGTLFTLHLRTWGSERLNDLAGFHS